MATEVVGSQTLVYLFGLVDFAAGLAIVLVNNVWTFNWTGSGRLGNTRPFTMPDRAGADQINVVARHQMQTPPKGIADRAGDTQF